MSGFWQNVLKPNFQHLILLIPRIKIFFTIRPHHFFYFIDPKLYTELTMINEVNELIMSGLRYIQRRTDWRTNIRTDKGDY